MRCKLNKTALITGASSGIGEEFAYQLSKQGWNLILVARSALKLQQMAEEIRNDTQVIVDVIIADLTDKSAPERIFVKTEELGRQIDLLVNNAGFGTSGPFLDNDRIRNRESIRVNVSALVELSYLYLPKMLQRKSGSILNVSSVAAFESTPQMAVYGATKAFVYHFSQSLWAEYHKQGIHVLALCPGPTATNFFQISGGKELALRMRTSKQVVETALRALNKKKLVAVDGFLNQCLIWFGKILPRKWNLYIINKVMR